MSLESIANVTITNTSVSVSQQGFGIPLILGYHTRWNDRARTYTSLAGMVADGFTSSDMEYKAAAAVFAQNPRPPSIVVGRRLTKSAQTVTLTPTAVNGAVYTVVINGTTFAYTADSSTSVQEIVEGIAALINAGSEPVTATEDDSVLTLTADTAGTGFSFKASCTDGATLLAQDVTADGGAEDSISDDLDDLLEASKAWYAIILTSKGKAEITAAAAWAESNKRVLLASTADNDCLGSGTSDVASSLKTSSYYRTLLMWHDAPYSYPEAAWAGKLLPEAPGSATWAFKTLAGIAAVETVSGKLTDTAIANLATKNCSTYSEVGGVNVTQGAKTSGGEWMDIVIGLDWLAARMKERIYARKVGAKKIPYTNAGIGIIVSEINAQLIEGSNAGLLVSGTEAVNAPDISAVSAADKASRTLNNVTFEAQLAGAIHATVVTGAVYA